MINAVIFDLDGTLLNTLSDLTDSLNVALQEYNFPTRTNEEVKEFLGGGIRVLVHRALKEHPHSESDEKNVLAKMHEEYDCRKMHKTNAYLGVPELIRDLKALNIKTAVLTNKLDDDAKDIIYHYFGEDAFDVICGKKDGMLPKPDPTSLFELIKELRMHQEEVIFVGDSDVDMQTALNAGVKKIGVLWGYRELNILQAYEPDYLVNEPNEILEIAKANHSDEEEEYIIEDYGDVRDDDFDDDLK
ncbi:MAG: HAD family hydrolase [Bacilli bacterium]|nr:HAD family hydrolase [Bacilli bacterium]